MDPASQREAWERAFAERRAVCLDLYEVSGGRIWKGLFTLDPLLFIQGVRGCLKAIWIHPVVERLTGRLPKSAR